MVTSTALTLALLWAQTDVPTEPIDACPEGSRLRGAAPPRGLAQWCEGPDLFGQMKKNGPFRAWHENGRIRLSGELVDGEKHGRWAEWDAEGNLVAESRFRFGRALETARRRPRSDREPGATARAPTGPSTPTDRAAPPRSDRRSTRPSSDWDRETSRLTTERPAGSIGGYAETDLVVYGTDGLATFGSELEAGLLVGGFEMGAQWGWVFADARGTNSAEALNPTFLAAYRGDAGQNTTLRFGAGASIPVRDLSADTLLGVAVVAAAGVPRGYWNAWMYLPRDPYIVLPMGAKVRTERVRFDSSATFFFAIPPENASSQLNLQLSAGAAYSITDVFAAGLDVRSVLLSLTATPEATLGFEPFAEIDFEPGFARAGFTVYPAYSAALSGPSGDGVVWGLDLAIGFEM